jgi:predicted MPP superfamily phosphohydrolase
MKKFKNIAWATDTHFDLANDKQFKKFLQSAEEYDTLLITGDIAQATSWQHYVYKVAKKLAPMPVFFILGNHDIYHSELSTEHDKLLSISVDNLYPLTIMPPYMIADDVAIVGHQNWWDGGYSEEYSNLIDRTFMFQDYTLIDNLKGLVTPEQRFIRLKGMSEASTTIIIEKVKSAFEQVDNVILAVHVPPFKENCTHFGLPMTTNFLSHFSSKILGDALFFLMRNMPDKKLLVLSGHTHEETTYSPLPNLTSRTNKANILKPRVHTILKLKDLF